MNKLVHKIIFLIGSIIAIGAYFIPADEGVFSEAGNGFSAIFKTPAEYIGFEIAPIVLTIVFFILPVVLLLASLVINFVTSKKKLGMILCIISAVIFVAGDILGVVNDNVYIGVFINLVGVIFVLVATALAIIGDDADDDYEDDEENEICGEVTCLSGEYAGGKFMVSGKLVIGHDASKANVVLSDKTISKTHCIIKYVPETDTYTVKDVSKNGTFFADGKKLAKNFEMQVPRLTEIYMGEKKERFLLD